MSPPTRLLFKARQAANLAYLTMLEIDAATQFEGVRGVGKTRALTVASFSLHSSKSHRRKTSPRAIIPPTSRLERTRNF